MVKRKQWGKILERINQGQQRDIIYPLPFTNFNIALTQSIADNNKWSWVNPLSNIQLKQMSVRVYGNEDDYALGIYWLVLGK